MCSTVRFRSFDVHLRNHIEALCIGESATVNRTCTRRYIDIDVHHGDAVEKAFYSSKRVVTVSFHKVRGAAFVCVRVCVCVCALVIGEQISRLLLFYEDALADTKPTLNSKPIVHIYLTGVSMNCYFTPVLEL